MNNQNNIHTVNPEQMYDSQLVFPSLPDKIAKNLPIEIVHKIFEELSDNYSKNWSTPIFVNKEWKVLFDSIHILRKATMQAAKESECVYKFIPRIEQKMFSYLSRWLDKEIDNCIKLQNKKIKLFRKSKFILDIDKKFNKTVEIIISNIVFIKFNKKKLENTEINKILQILIKIDHYPYYEYNNTNYVDIPTAYAEIAYDQSSIQNAHLINIFTDDENKMLFRIQKEGNIKKKLTHKKELSENDTQSVSASSATINKMTRSPKG